MTFKTPVEIDFINRDISWLHFNARVLQEAADPKVPLLERLRFLGIFSNNLDEFFRVRYATIKRIDLAGKEGKKQLGGVSASELMQQITEIVISHQAESLNILSQIEKELEQYNVFMLKENELSEQQTDFVRDYYLQEVSPAIATLMLNDIDEMPNLRDNASYLAVRMTMKQPVKSPKVKYALIEIPRYLKRFVILPKDGDKTYIIIVDDLIRSRLHYIFSIFDYVSIEAHMIKITRDAELDLDSDLSKSFLEKIYNSVQSRIKGDPVRFVYDKTIHPDTLKFLQEKMGIDNTDSIIPGGRYHNRRDYMKFPTLNIPGLAYEKLSPVPITDLEPRGSILSKIKQKDYLLHTPYHPFGYIIKFLREAAIDPEVKTIKITIYRLAEISHVAGALINAARNGKEVIVQIELRARF
ncbi:MAG: polyphosphate kinase 1, partial [Flavobacteriaceae bacterium]|nr:polyphosphate kinase 1 [Flavobacteriaceae bacterium]